MDSHRRELLRSPDSFHESQVRVLFVCALGVADCDHILALQQARRILRCLVFLRRGREHCVRPSYAALTSAREVLLTKSVHSDYWGYFDIIRKHMPQNCSADVQAVIGHIDDVFTSGNETAIDEIKQLFGMNITHLDDFASACESASVSLSRVLTTLTVQNPLWEWQSLQPSPDRSGGVFYQFCDALEVKDNQTAPEAGWGLDYALPAWAQYWTESYYPYCKCTRPLYVCTHS